ncbi:hypothetical protein ABL78_7084 [Leptomonas seymouri]|uniref:Uncharacterized protein n=1 Tax=Leptomonas seymouri TaxID=5684 RepID=A0A0N0P393_LEPSE|nr:hypothetical protein ABL78_7084 [Leptomonas seymouri]|eukprot:KPI83866.1 hypothetical protein ABL78_7084 [Leptomonas seymouri]
MDLPFHLRLAYASHCSDPYADSKRRLTNALFVSSGALAAQTETSWLNSLVKHLQYSHERYNEAHLSTDRTVEEADAAPVAPAVCPCEHPEEGKTEEVQAHIVSSSPPTTSSTSPTASHSIAEQDALTLRPGLPSLPSLLSLDEDRVKKRRFSPPFIEERSPSSAASGPASETSTCKDDDTCGHQIKKADANVQVDVAADTVNEEHHRRVQAQLAGTHEALLADITTSLERRLQQCVLKTLALDDANQQLICAFHIRPNASTSADERAHPATATSLSPAPPEERISPADLAKEVDSYLSGAQASPAAVGNTKAAAVLSTPTLTANRNEQSISVEAKKELALHLHTLRNQVVHMRRQLDAHEAMHSRRMAAIFAASKESSDRPPIRVEIVKAYEEEPVPYRKGPWRKADFAAAAHRTAGGKGRGGQGEKNKSRSSDDFTDYSSSWVTSSEVLTEMDGRATSDESGARAKHQSGERGKPGAAAAAGGTAIISSIDSDSSLSSTEELFKKRQAAAMQARAQRAATTAARQQSRYSSETSSSSYSSSDSSYSSMTETSTTTSSGSYTTR